MKKILSAVLFILTLVLTYQFFSLFSGGSLRDVLALVATIPASIWVLLALLTACFYAMDWIRFRSLLSVLGHPLRWLDGLQLTCVSYFVTSLTPMAELHTPAMVFMLSRKRVPTPQALAASITKSIYMTLWICLASYVSLFFDRSIALPEALRLSLPVLTLPLLAIALVLALIAFFPAPVVDWTRKKSEALRPASLTQKIVLGIGQSAEAISTIGKSGQLQHWICHLASIAFLLLYVAIGWVLAGFFGFSLSLLQALTIFSTSLMVAYLAPVPGAIGVTELSTSYMLDPGFTQEGMAVSLTLRILCWYLVALPGGLVLAQAFRQQGTAWKFPTIFK